MPAEPPRPLTSEETAVIEQNAVALGVSLDHLMENAGRAVAEEAARRLPAPPARVAIVAGTGNNGGDGTCAAFYLQQWGYSPEVWLVRPPPEIRSRSARRCFERIEHRLPVHRGAPKPEELRTMPLVIDALLGSGQTDRLRPPILDAVAAIQAGGAPVLSVDLPTGSRDPNGVRPKWTVALTAVKAEMDPATAGEVAVREIGIPAEAWRRTGPGEFAVYPAPAARSRRGRAARILVIGGGPYSGAPALAGLSALRSGAERATVFAPGGSADRIQGFSPNLVVRAFGEDRLRPADVPDVLDAFRSAPPAAVALGMGSGSHPDTVAALRALELELAGKVPLVVDADGLAALPDLADSGIADPSPLLATPNPGEFVRYFAQGAPVSADARPESVRAAAAGRRVVVVAKGDPDVISDGTTVVENHHHHPSMTVSGVGDVLAGVLASLLGQGVRPIPAARLSTYWVGEAGIVAASRRSFGLVATDVVDELPAALAAGLARSHRPE